MPHQPVVGIVDPLELDRIAPLVRMGLQRTLAESALNCALLRVVTAELLAAEHGAKLLELGLVQHLIVLRIFSRHSRNFVEVVWKFFNVRAHCETGKSARGRTGEQDARYQVLLLSKKIREKVFERCTLMGRNVRFSYVNMKMYVRVHTYI